MATADGEKTYSYQLRVRSLDPSQPVADVVARINELSPQMAGELKEYGSNVKVSAYAKWDDPRWRFSDAHLLSAAKYYLKEELRRKDRPRLPFLGQHFAAIRGNKDPDSQSDLQRAEDCFVEAYDVATERLITHFLEWATFPATDSERQERSKILSGFHALVKDPVALDTAFGNPYSGFEKVDQRLNAMVGNAIKIRKKRK